MTGLEDWADLSNAANVHMDKLVRNTRICSTISTFQQQQQQQPPLPSMKKRRASQLSSASSAANHDYGPSQDDVVMVGHGGSGDGGGVVVGHSIHGNSSSSMDTVHPIHHHHHPIQHHQHLMAMHHAPPPLVCMPEVPIRPRLMDMHVCCTDNLPRLYPSFGATQRELQLTYSLHQRIRIKLLPHDVAMEQQSCLDRMYSSDQVMASSVRYASFCRPFVSFWMEMGMYLFIL